MVKKTDETGSYGRAVGEKNDLRKEQQKIMMRSIMGSVRGLSRVSQVSYRMNLHGG